MGDEFAGLDPDLCRALAAEFREIAVAFGDDAREMARIDREGMLGTAGPGVELLFETEDDLIGAAELLERKCDEVEAIEWMTHDGAVDVLHENFALLDTAGGKHDPDGIVSADDLVAVSETSTDPELLKALSLMNVGVFHMLDTGGRPKQKGDQRFSKFDLNVVKEMKVSFTDFTEHASTLAANTRLLDTAAHGGTGDGTYSVNDLKALVQQKGSDPKLKVAVAYFLKNQDQLTLVEGFKASQAHIGVRIIKGLGGAVPTLNHIVNPVTLYIDFARKPYETTQRQISFYKGAGGAIVGMGKGLWEVEKAVDPLYGLIDPAGQRKAQLQWKEAGVAAWRHPGKAFEMIIDIETLENDPDRWVGQLAPDAVISALTGGGGTITKGVKVARAFKQLRHLDDFKALTKLDKLRALSKVSKGVTINIALNRAEDIAETTAKAADDIARVAAKTDTVTGPTPTIPAASKADDLPDVDLKIETKPDADEVPSTAPSRTRVPSKNRSAKAQISSTRQPTPLAVTPKVLSPTLSSPHVSTRGQRKFLLEQGTGKAGWKHIYDRHVDPLKFPSKSKFPSSLSETDVLKLLDETLKRGKRSTYSGNEVFEFRTNFRGAGYRSYRATVLPGNVVQTFHPLG